VEGAVSTPFGRRADLALALRERDARESLGLDVEVKGRSVVLLMPAIPPARVLSPKGRSAERPGQLVPILPSRKNAAVAGRES
jgi:hypothetical protein